MTALPEMIRVTTPADIEAIARLADEIWHQHFVPIVGRDQVDYMLRQFQSVPAITRQIADGYEYYLVEIGEGRVGYFALVPHPAQGKAELSKIYVRQAQRRHGLGRAIMAFVEARCRELGIRDLSLIVNRNNTESIAFYRRMGFEEAADLVQDIGGGFVKNDKLMVKPISRHR